MKRILWLWIGLAGAAIALATVAWFGVTHAATLTQPAVGVTISADVPAFTPRVVLAQVGQIVQFSNTTARDVDLVGTPHNPAPFHLTLPSGGTVSLTLSRPGLYHYYDAAEAHVVDFQAGSDVVRARPDAPDPNLTAQGWIIVPGPGGVPADARIDVPALHDLFDPQATAVRVGGSVVIHNHDTDAHNIVTDPADPAGAAFELLGTDGEPTIGGAERRVTFTRPGLYHFYCSIHTRVAGMSAPMQMVVPRDSNASGYADGEPMETWVLVLP